MTTEDTKILKLSSGEEVICNVVSNPEQSHISVVYPMKMQSYPKATKNGIEESLSLQRWIHFAEEDTFNIEKTNVITMTEASYGLSKFYQYCVNKAKREDEGTMAELPTDGDLDLIEEEEIFDEYEPISKVYH